MRKLINTLPVMIFAKQMSQMINSLLMMMEAGRREKGYIAEVLTCDWIFNRYTSKTHPQERFKISQLKCLKHGLHDEGASIIAKPHKFKIIESTIKQKLTSDLLLLLKRKVKKGLSCLFSGSLSPKARMRGPVDWVRRRKRGQKED